MNVDLSGGIVSAWPVEKTHGVLAWIFHLQGHLTRIDLALDDRQAAVPVDQIREAIEVGQLITRAKSYDWINRRHTATGSLRGTTISIGSVESETMLRIYDKRLELQEKGRPDWSEVWCSMGAAVAKKTRPRLGRATRLLHAE